MSRNEELFVNSHRVNYRSIYWFHYQALDNASLLNMTNYPTSNHGCSTQVRCYIIGLGSDWFT